MSADNTQLADCMVFDKRSISLSSIRQECPDCFVSLSKSRLFIDFFILFGKVGYLKNNCLSGYRLISQRSLGDKPAFDNAHLTIYNTLLAVLVGAHSYDMKIDLWTNNHSV